jgi:hypothetical protein
MAKSTKDARDPRPPADTQKIYAHAYGVRLAKQVAGGVEESRQKATGRKRSGGKA